MGAPNIIFILIDDMGWRDLGCYGSEFYETPQLDRFADTCTRFTEAYAACPVCSPTRASVLTGRYPATLGMTDWINWGGGLHPARGRLIDVPYISDLPSSELCLARAMAEGGYATWHVGKWHLGGPGHLPEDHGFERNVGGCQAGSPGHGGYFSPWSIPALENADVPDGTYLTDHLTEEAIQLIRGRDERPFFLNLWYYTVHTPIQAKEEKTEKYRDKARDLGLDEESALEEGELFPCEHKKDQRVLRRRVQSDPVYAAMVESLDENIGRVLRTLDEEGIAGETVVIFTSDNGGLATSEGSPTCNAPLAEGKGWMYEGGTREPLLIRWPGVATSCVERSSVVTSPDFYPTILDMAGLEAIPQQHCDGVSLVPLLRGGELERPAVYWHYPHYGNQGGTPGSSVRRGQYKLIEFFEDSRLELYDLGNDIGEDHNLTEEQPERTRELHRMLVDWRARVGARIPEPNPEWLSS